MSARFDRYPMRGLIVLFGTLALSITFLRLIGELRSWNGQFFGSDAGGGAAVVGIGWLIPVFGIVAGQVLARAGHGPRSLSSAWGRTGLGVGVVFAGFAVATQVLGPVPSAMALGGAGCVAGAVIAAPAWPALARASLQFALLCRIPILVITPIAIAGDWGTHYEKLTPGAPEVGPLARTLVLCAAQLVFWIPITVLGAMLSALVSRPRLGS